MPTRTQNEINDENHAQYVSLAHHLDTEIGLVREVIATGMNAIKESMQVRDKVIDARLEIMNGIRDQLRDQAGTMATRIEVDQHKEQRLSDVKRLEAAIAKADRNFSVLVGLLIGSGLLGGTAGAVLAKLL